MIERIRAFIRAHIIDTEPADAPLSRLDALDGVFTAQVNSGNSANNNPKES